MNPDLLAFLTLQEQQLVHTPTCDCEAPPCILHARKEDQVGRLLIALAQARQELRKCKDDRNTLVSQNEELGYRLLKVQGEWPATDGSPMGILQAKLQQAQEAVKAEHRKWCAGCDPLAGGTHSSLTGGANGRSCR